MIEDRTFFLLATLFYVTAFLLGISVLWRSKKFSHTITLSLIVGGLGLQTIALYQRGMVSQSCPLGNPFEVIQFITWSTVLLYIVIGPAYRMSLLGLFSSGFASILNLLTIFITKWDYAYQPSLFNDSPWLETHASLAIFSYGVFSILALTSGMYIIQNYGLKHKQSHSLFPYLPSVAQLDKMNCRLLIIGITVLTFSLLIGSVYWVDNWNSVTLIKIIFSLLIWLGYFLSLILYKAKRLFPEKFAWTCIIMFIFSLLSLWPIRIGQSELRSSQKSIEEMAKEHSKCPSGQQGGALGEFVPGQMVKEFDDVVFTGDIGVVHGPVKTQFGYHLVEITNRVD